MPANWPGASATADPTLSRRRLLSRALKLLALGGVLAFMVPLAGFLGDTLAPAAGTDGTGHGVIIIPVAELVPGTVREVRWRGRPLWIHRAAGGVAVFHPFESVRGCKVHHLPAAAPGTPAGWSGGFGEPCFGALFDAAGRRLPGTGDPRQGDLEGPRHHVDAGGRLVVGAPP
ncbi:MAG: hypothetical protein U5S82_01500 [Gammaproteobacteria bacterium]|nr:hypothetical protein [Gammaproteobacteria bacterium]